MKISIKHLAKLANFDLSKEQEETMEKSIPSVVGYMEEIKNLDVGSVSETNFASEEKNITRDDVIELSLSQVSALSNAKKTHKGFFVVPYVFEEGK